MKGSQRCGNCRFFLIDVVRRMGQSFYNDKKEFVHSIRGECRRHPPMRFRDGSTEQPVVDDYEWCGDWIADKPDSLDFVVLGLAQSLVKGDATSGMAMLDRANELMGEQGKLTTGDG